MVASTPEHSGRGADWDGSPVADLRFDAGEFPTVYPDDMTNREQWMGAEPGSKKPIAPWGTRDPPVECTSDGCAADRCDDPACECDGRFKWGYSGHYRTGDQVDIALTTGEIKYRAYIFEADDPYVFADLDDVRCPETGAVHPAALAFISHLGATWTEVSSSGAGLHAVYRGELPDGLKQAVLQIDDSAWGENDEEDVPKIELYDTARKTGVLTGSKIPGAPETVESCDASALRSILEAHGELDATGRPRDSKPEEPDFPGVNPGGDADTNDSSDVTDDMEDVFNAVDALDARDVARDTIAREWTDKSGDVWAFAPTWSSADYDGTAVVCGPDAYRDMGDCGGRGGPVVMAAIDCADLPYDERGVMPGDVAGEDYLRAVEHLRDLGYTSIPEYVPDGDTAALYMDVLGDYAPGYANPYEDPDACLEASLRAREDGAVSEDADAPTLALHAIINHMMPVDAGSHAVDDSTLSEAQRRFEYLSVEMVNDRFGLGDDGDGDSVDGDGDSVDGDGDTDEGDGSGVIVPDDDGVGFDRSRGDVVTNQTAPRMEMDSDSDAGDGLDLDRESWDAVTGGDA